MHYLHPLNSRSASIVSDRNRPSCTPKNTLSRYHDAFPGCVCTCEIFCGQALVGTYSGAAGRLIVRTQSPHRSRVDLHFRPSPFERSAAAAPGTCNLPFRTNERTSMLLNFRVYRTAPVMGSDNACASRELQPETRLRVPFVLAHRLAGAYDSLRLVPDHLEQRQQLSRTCLWEQQTKISDYWQMKACPGNSDKHTTCATSSQMLPSEERCTSGSIKLHTDLRLRGRRKSRTPVLDPQRRPVTTPVSRLVAVPSQNKLI